MKKHKKKTKRPKMTSVKTSQWKYVKSILEEICRREKFNYKLWCSEWDEDPKDLKGNSIKLYARAMLALGRKYEYTTSDTSD